MTTLFQDQGDPFERRLEPAERRVYSDLYRALPEELPDRPNPSYRNIVRLGLPVRYVRSNWGPRPLSS